VAARLAVAVVVVVVAARPARAHPLDVGYLHVGADGPEITVTLDLDVAGAARLLATPVEGLDAAAIAARGAALAAATIRGAPITSERGPCTWAGPVAARLDGKTVRISDGARCPEPGAAGANNAGGARRWRFPFVRDAAVSATFELLVKQTVGDGERVTLVDRYEPELVLATPATATGFAGFVWSGIRHIGVAPSEWSGRDGAQLPDGIDHILFLIALLLGGGSLVQLLAIATGFTLGHSITLALAALAVVRPPATVIEPLIALSIALAAAEAFVGTRAAHRWKIASGFGLVHGFGFAAALVSLELSSGDTARALFGYNLGVELGQVAIVLAVAPLVLLAGARAKPALRAIAATIFVAGLYWFVERLVG
jgi:hypothetical protein